MDWYRRSRNTSQSRSLDAVARVTRERRAFVLAIWDVVLEHACGQPDRGSLADFDLTEAALCLDIELESAERIFGAMRERGLLTADGARVAKWEEYNPKREDPTAAERQRKHRERQRSAPPPNGGGHARDENEPGTSRDVTQRNAGVTPDNATVHNKTEDSLSGADAPDSSDCPAATPSTPLKPRDLYPELSRLPMVGKRYVYPDEFERFWRIWRGALNANDSKDAAYSAWRKPLVKGTADPDDLVAGAERHARSDTVANGFRCLTSTWISRSGWTASYEPTHRPEQSHLRVVAGGNRRPVGSITAAADDLLARYSR